MEIELPDGTVLDAPDDADPSTVAKAYLAKQQPKQAAPQQKYDPTQGNTTLPIRIPGTDIGTDVQAPESLVNFMAGAGQGVVNAGRGIKQLGMDAYGLVNPQAAQDYKNQISESKRLDAPLMNTKAGLAGAVTGNLAATMIPGAAVARGAQALGMARTAGAANAFLNPATYKTALGAGALQGAIQPVGEGDSRILNTALGAGTGWLAQGVSNIAGRIAQPLKQALSPSQNKAVGVLESASVPLDAAQKSGSPRAAQLKRLVTDNPLTASGQVAQFEKTAAGFDRAALKTIGETADVADETVMSRAANRIGGVMDAIADRNPITVDNPLLTKIADISSKAGKELESPQAAVIHGQVDEIIDKASTTGKIDGKAYQNIRDALGRLSGSGSPGVKHWAGQLRGALDDALQRSASPADVTALKQARIQWRNLEGISKVIGSEEGQHISPAKLANALNTKAYGGKGAMVRGRGATDLMRLAKAGKAVLPEKFPQSGTAPRMALQLLAPGAVGAGLGYAKEGDLSGALTYGAAAAALPWLAQQALNRPGAANYLANGLQPGIMRSLLMAPQDTLPGLLARHAVPQIGLLEAASQ